MQDIWMMIKFGMLAFVVVFAIVYFVDKYKNQIRR